MEYTQLLNLVTELSYQLAMCGAETYRVEESAKLVLRTYGVEAEVFAIPNCLHISIEPVPNQPMTRMCRIGDHGSDLDSVERFTGVSRRICAEKPDPAVAMEWVQEAIRNRRSYRLPMYLLGNYLGSFGFALLFGGTIADGICSGFCGIAAGLVTRFLVSLGANQFFRTTAAAFPMALLAYIFEALGLAQNPDCVTIGALMLLVPGLLITNAMRDILYGDTNSGVHRVVQVLLIAVAIALGTGAAWNTATALWGSPSGVGVVPYTLLEQLVPCFIGCIGFTILFNIHGPGGLLCGLGGMLSWVVYILAFRFSGNDLVGYFWSTLFAAAYSETMARIRKYPAISYLVISIFPLIPGAGVYYTTNYAMQGQMDLFASQAMHTAAIAGTMALSILLVTTLVRMYTTLKRNRHA